MILVFFL